MAAQQEFFDMQMRHQIGINRVSAGEVKRILNILDRSTKEINRKLRERATRGDFTSKRYQEMLRDIRAIRKEMFQQIVKSNRTYLKDVAQAEQLFAKGMLETAVPIRLDFATAEVARLNALVTENPFTAGTNAAKSLNQWWSTLSSVDSTRIIDAVQLGMVQNETIEQMVGRVTRATNMTRNNAEAVVRTAANHASNVARNEFFKQNAGVIGSLMWSAMLDGRTTITCASRDGHHAPVDGTTWTNVPEPHLDDPLDRPPAHVRCRSYMVAKLDANGLEQKMPPRPFVRDTQTRRWREKNFRADAKANVGAKKWSKMSREQRNAQIRAERKAWTQRAVGTVSGHTTYDQWLRTQPVSFQNDVLGVAKAKAFRKGLALDKFVDRNGGELTLAQLSERFPKYVGDPR